MTIVKRGRRPKIIRNPEDKNVLGFEPDRSVENTGLKRESFLDQDLEIDDSAGRESHLDFSCVKNKVVENMDFSESDFSCYDIRGFVFRNCNFRGSDFTGACLQGVLFEECDLSDIVTTDADVRWSSLDVGNH